MAGAPHPAVSTRVVSTHRFLMKVLDSYGDDYRASQFTIVLEVRGSSRPAVGSTGSVGPGHPLQLPLSLRRTRAARARTPRPLATRRMSLQTRRGCLHPEARPCPQNPAAQRPERGPAGAGGGEHPGTCDGQGQR